MSSGLVKEAATYHHILVANAMHAIGYRWSKPRRVTNVRVMLGWLPRHDIEMVVGLLRKGPKTLHTGRGVPKWSPEIQNLRVGKLVASTIPGLIVGSVDVDPGLTKKGVD
jgi:hypothetical protein